MKRYNCTSSDKRGAFGLCMEEHKEGAFVPFSEISGLAEQLADATRQCGVMAGLLREAIGEVPQTQSFPSRCDAALAGKMPDRQDTEWTDATTSPVAADYRELQGQHDQLQSKHKVALDLLQESHEVMRRIIPPLPQDCAKRGDLLDRIEVALAGKATGRIITDEQEFELTTVLQSIVNGFSDDPAHDAAALLKRIAGEVPWTGDSFQLPSRQGGEPCAIASPSSSPA